MKVIITANRRGGAGKTATAHAIGAGLARKGYKILFIDLDSQTDLTYDLAADPSRYSAMDVLTGAVPAAKVIQHKAEWDLIPASRALDAADIAITGKRKEYRLRDALMPISSKYDFCVIDTPPALNIITANALTAAAGVVITAQPEIHSIQGVGLLYDTLRQVRQASNKELSIYGILLTRYSGRAVLSKDMRSNIEAVAAQIGTKVYSTPIRECVAVKEAQASQQDIFKYAPRSNAAKDYRVLIDELLEDLKGDN